MERLVFDYTMSSLIQVLGQPLTPEHLASLVALGVDPSRPLLPAYPVELYGRVMEFIARERWPHVTADVAHFELGRAFMRAYRQTTMGRGVASVSQRIGPHRALERMDRNFRSANNYTETRLRKLAPSLYELWFNHAPHADYYRGLLTESLERAGAQQLSVAILSRGLGGEATFRIAWKE
jgi:uncharacterized protein (TIGR02265 family)